MCLGVQRRNLQRKKIPKNAIKFVDRYYNRYVIGETLMRGLGGLLDCLDAQHHVVCPVYVPPERGDCLCVFELCFPPSM